MITMMIVLLCVLLLLGLPLFTGIIAASVIGLFTSKIDLMVIPLEIYRLADSPVLPAIPLFTFAGYLLAEGETSKRLVTFSRSLLGWLPGGLGVVALITCTFFTAITGATGVTIIALGGLLYPALIAEKYSDNFSLGLMTASGSLGILFPPSLPIILYGYISGVNINDLFIAGIIPGIFITGVLCIYSIAMGKKWNLEKQRFSFWELLQSLKIAIWELPIPILIVSGIYSGFCTASEAAAITAVYVLFIKTIVFREISIVKDLPAIIKESIKMVGGIMIILGAALSFTSYLVDAFVPMKILNLMETVVDSKLGFLLILNLFLIIVGCMMDIFSAILVTVPLIMPLAERFGVDPIHLGIIFLANLAIGYNTPPVGLNLFIASSRFNKPVVSIYIATLPFLLLLALTLLAITYFPEMSLFILH